MRVWADGGSAGGAGRTRAAVRVRISPRGLLGRRRCPRAADLPADAARCAPPTGLHVGDGGSTARHTRLRYHAATVLLYA